MLQFEMSAYLAFVSLSKVNFLVYFNRIFIIPYFYDFSRKCTDNRNLNAPVWGNSLIFYRNRPRVRSRDLICDHVTTQIVVDLLMTFR